MGSFPLLPTTSISGWFYARSSRRSHLDLRLTCDLMPDSVSRHARCDGLVRLESLHLVNVSRLPGRAHQITLLEPGTDRALRMAPGQVGVKLGMGVYR